MPKTLKIVSLSIVNHDRRAVCFTSCNAECAWWAGPAGVVGQLGWDGDGVRHNKLSGTRPVRHLLKKQEATVVQENVQLPNTHYLLPTTYQTIINQLINRLLMINGSWLMDQGWLGLNHHSVLMSQ